MDQDDQQEIAPGPPMELEVSSSPRTTWVWAADRAGGEAVRAVLRDAGLRWYGKARDNDRVTHVDIGVVANEALEALLAAGYTFRWHPDEQEHLHRRPTLWGVAVAPGQSVDDEHELGEPSSEG